MKFKLFYGRDEKGDMEKPVITEFEGKVDEIKFLLKEINSLEQKSESNNDVP